MSLSVKEMLDRDLSVKLSQLVGSTLVFVINEHWLAKKELKSSAFSLKLVMNLLSWKIGGMQGTFLPVKRLFKIDQYVFELVLGSDNSRCGRVNFLLYFPGKKAKKEYFHNVDHEKITNTANKFLKIWILPFW